MPKTYTLGGGKSLQLPLFSYTLLQKEEKMCCLDKEQRSRNSDNTYSTTHNENTHYCNSFPSMPRPIRLL